MTYSESPFSQLSDELWQVFGGYRRFPTTRAMCTFFFIKGPAGNGRGSRSANGIGHTRAPRQYLPVDAAWRHRINTRGCSLTAPRQTRWCSLMAPRQYQEMQPNGTAAIPGDAAWRHLSNTRGCSLTAPRQYQEMQPNGTAAIPGDAAWRHLSNTRGCSLMAPRQYQMTEMFTGISFGRYSFPDGKLVCSDISKALVWVTWRSIRCGQVTWQGSVDVRGARAAIGSGRAGAGEGDRAGSPTVAASPPTN